MPLLSGTGIGLKAAANQGAESNAGTAPNATRRSMSSVASSDQNFTRVPAVPT